VPLGDPSDCLGGGMTVDRADGVLLGFSDRAMIGGR
jgi:hypothetical protein